MTEYIDQGISQSHGQGVAQGAIQSALPVGGHAALWGSNVDFDDGWEATVELNYILGMESELGESLLGASIAYIHYPGADGALRYDLVELSASIERSLGSVSLSAERIFAPQRSGNVGDAVYFASTIGRPLTEALTLGAHAGRQWHERESIAGPNSIDWGMAVE